jgi:hypothetical protein
VTPRGRANANYYAGLALCTVGGITVLLGRARSSDIIFAVGVILLAGYVALAVFGLATSRCPHCRRHIDLRGSSAYCPRCGRWIPAHEGDAPPPDSSRVRA